MDQAIQILLWDATAVCAQSHICLSFFCVGAISQFFGFGSRNVGWVKLTKNSHRDSYSKRGHFTVMKQAATARDYSPRLLDEFAGC